MDNNKKIVKLSRPIEIYGDKVESLEIEEPLVKHYEMLDQLGLKISQDGSVEVKNLGSLGYFAAKHLANGGLTDGDAKKIPLVDLFSIAAAVADFFGLSVPIGNTQPG